MKLNYLKYALLSILGIFILFEANAQNSYDFFVTQGTTSPFKFDMSDNNVNVVFKGDTNNYLSSPQAIGFDWEFYGNTVTHFKISENGYITFDTNATNSVAANTNIPQGAAPNYAIYAFWDDWRVTSGTQPARDQDAIRTWTYGSAPNRVHVIQWYSMTLEKFSDEPGSIRLSYGIRLYERGGFDIVYNEAFHQDIQQFAGTIGAESPAGTEAIKYEGLGNAPNSRMPILEGAAGDDFVINFYPVRTYDARAVRLNLPVYETVNNNVEIAGFFSSLGTEDITSYTVNYSVNGGSPVSQSVNNPDDTIFADTTLAFRVTHPTSWVPQQTNQMYTIRMWLSNINGNMDENPRNDTVIRNVFVNDGLTQDKKVLLEEFTSTRCGFCVDGLRRIEDDLAPKYGDQLIYASHHQGRIGNDGMSSGSEPELASRLGPLMNNVSTVDGIFSNIGPYAAIDRTFFQERSQIVAPDLKTFNISTWDRYIDQKLNEPTPATIDISAKNDGLGGADITYNIEFVDHPRPGDYRISVMVIENNVSRNDNSVQWAQSNLFSQDANNGPRIPSHPLYTESDPIVGYEHPNVVREIITQTWGRDLQILDPAKGDTYENESDPFYVTAQAKGWDIDNLSVIVFVNVYDEFNENELYVVNADITSLQVLNTEEFDKDFSASLYPNPSQTYSQLSVEMDARSDMNISLLNTMGQQVQSIFNGTLNKGEHKFDINTANLNAGIYIVQFTKNGESFSKRLIVQ